MSTLIFFYTTDLRVTRDMWLTDLDINVFLLTFTIFIGLHLAIIGWIYSVPLGYRRRMKTKDNEYRRALTMSLKKPTCRISENDRKPIRV